MLNKEKFIDASLVAIALFVFLMLLTVWTIVASGNAQGQDLSPEPALVVKPTNNLLKKPVCSDEELDKRVGLHAPEITSCDTLIAWQNEVADKLGVPRLTSVAEGMHPNGVGERFLVPVLGSKYIDVSRVPVATRYVAPQVKIFLEKIGVEFYTLRHKPLPLRSLVRFYETREERNSMHRRGLAVDISCLYLNQGDVDALRSILKREAHQNHAVQPAEESYIGLWVRKRVNKVITFHVVVFNASFLTSH